MALLHDIAGGLPAAQSRDEPLQVLDVVFETEFIYLNLFYSFPVSFGNATGTGPLQLYIDYIRISSFREAQIHATNLEAPTACTALARVSRTSAQCPWFTFNIAGNKCVNTCVTCVLRTSLCIFLHVGFYAYAGMRYTVTLAKRLVVQVAAQVAVAEAILPFAVWRNKNDETKT